MLKKSTGTPGENEILKFLQDRQIIGNSNIRMGIGDDAAVIRQGKTEEYRLVSTDMLVEDVDFRRKWTSPRQLGRKSLSVNLSDLAAMGAVPKFFTVALGLPTDISMYWIKEFYRGLTERAEGGDLSSSRERIVVSITALGASVERKVVYRSGGKAGDILYVTGTLGLSAAGLKILETGCIHPRNSLKREAVQTHRDPEPRCRSGMWLAHCGMVRCMMDLSDGLSADLPRLCSASGTAAEIDVSKLPVHREATAWGWDPVALALHGGEDFELLFAVKGNKSKIFEKSYPAELPPVTRIGQLIPGNGEVWIYGARRRRQRLKNMGYEHFSRYND
ncbi:MAG: thiamine-phosphate kinase [Acidobacteriota bacterium]